MTNLEHPYRADRRWRAATPSIVLEYALVLAVIVLVGALALAEVSGVLDSLVHSISLMA